MVNPFTKEEIENDLRDLREGSYFGFYKRPLGQLLFGMWPTKTRFNDDTKTNVIKFRNDNLPNQIVILKRLQTWPHYIIERLTVEKSKELLNKIRSYKNALLMGCISPASLNNLAKKLSTIGFEGKITVVEKEANISKMLKHNIENFKGIKVEIKTDDVLRYQVEKNKNYLIFCDVLGYYLTDKELDFKFPKFLNQFKNGSLAFICDLNELDYNNEQLVITCGLGNKLDKYELIFKDWLTKAGFHITDKEILELRKRLFERNEEKPKRTGLLERYKKNLKKYKLVVNSSVTIQGYIKNGVPTRYFDYMLFEKTN